MLLKPIYQVFEETGNSFRRTLVSGDRIPFHSFRDVGGLAVASGAVAILDDDPVLGGRAVEVVGVGELVNINQWNQAMPGSVGLVQGLADTTLVGLETAVWEGLMSGDEAFAGAVREIRAGQYERMVKRTGAMRLDDPVRRLAAVLVQVADIAGLGCEYASGCHVSVTQDGLAAVAGISRQTTNRILSQFRANRLIHIERGFLCVMDIAGLSHVYAGDSLGAGEPVSFRCKTRNSSICLECAPAVVDMVVNAS